MDINKSCKEVSYKVIGNNKFEVLVEGDYYRVTSISRMVGVDTDRKLLVEYMPLSYGLAIEKRSSKNTFTTIANCEWVNKKVIFKDVDFRSINSLKYAEKYQVEEYVNCVQFARQALADINADKEN